MEIIAIELQWLCRVEQNISDYCVTVGVEYVAFMLQQKKIVSQDNS